MNDILISIFTGITIGIIVAVVGGLINRSLIKNLDSKEARDTEQRAEGEARQKAIASGVLAILHSELYTMVETAYFRGVVGYDEFDNIAHLYAPYVALGGNGTIERRFKQIDEFPRVKDEEIEEEGKRNGSDIYN